MGTVCKRVSYFYSTFFESYVAISIGVVLGFPSIQIVLAHSCRLVVCIGVHLADFWSAQENGWKDK
ncbi:hypothetical protein [Oceanobacillus sp. J11TS1]|uniref:hypothetical protein n=1 Tax=Oceanobacillus sp. J11TS1 TaxID=2807191 RepID=UPI001B03FACC|nr:hypothetical protein [Oceanobacillus sp. J11TS1]GIO22349.1 hypothetical protein J11TS1_09300 [Oceanobacillus sp. J11TS1]